MAVPERFSRFIDRAAAYRLAAFANLYIDDSMQDWPLEVCDASRLDEFIALLEGADDEDDRFVRMHLVLYSLDEADSLKQRELWASVERLLVRDTTLYADPILYWSLGDEADDGTWVLDDLSEHDGGFSITPLMRGVLVRVATTLDLRLA